MKKKKNSLKKAQRGIVFGICGCFLLIFLIILLLTQHLFAIRITERLANVKDYKDFKITVEKIPFCEQEMTHLFQIEDTLFSGICISEIQVNYGRTKASLERVLKERFITMDDVLKKMSRMDDIAEKNIAHYAYQRSNDENGNYRLTKKNTTYNTVSFEEYVFELY